MKAPDVRSLKLPGTWVVESVCPELAVVFITNALGHQALLLLKDKNRIITGQPRGGRPQVTPVIETNASDSVWKALKSKDTHRTLLDLCKKLDSQVLMYKRDGFSYIDIPSIMFLMDRNVQGIPQDNPLFYYNQGGA